MLRFLIPIITILWTINVCYATNYYSVQPGGYGTNSTWITVPSVNPSAPPDYLPFGDTVFIYHDVTYNKNIFFDGVFIVENTGTFDNSKSVTINIIGAAYLNGNVNISTSYTNNGYSEIIASLLVKTFENNQGGTVDVYGTLNPRYFHNHSILNNYNNLFINVSNGTFINYGDATLTNTAELSTETDLENVGALINSGTVNASKDINNEGSIVSNGLIDVIINLNNNGSITNSGYINVTGHFFNYASLINSAYVTVLLDFINDGSTDNNAYITVSENFENAGTLENNTNGSINITLDYTNTGSVNNSGYLNTNTVLDQGYTCNSGSIQVTQGNNYDCDGCTVTCGGYTTTCILDLKSGSDISNQNYCCQDNSNTLISLATAGNPTFMIDSATIFICGVPLPVELLSFSGKALDNGTNEITWVTATEMNNAYFVVEKSYDGEQWRFVKQVEGAGYSDQVLHYTIVDEKTLIGTTYYRLKQVDYNGDFKYYDPISILREKGEKRLSAYPNPSKDVLYLKSTEIITPDHLLFSSLSGENINNHLKIIDVSDHSLTLDLSALPSGVYILQYDGEVHRIVIQY